MESSKETEQSFIETDAKCVHVVVDSKQGLCQCKIELEAKFQDFKAMTGEIYKQELLEHKKKANVLTANLIRKNHQFLIEKQSLEKDVKLLQQKVDALQKLSDNSTKQNKLCELRIEKQQTKIVQDLAKQNKELQVNVKDLQERLGCLEAK